jgi:hypothetical protein
MVFRKAGDNAVSFALYMIGFLVFIAGIVWACVVVGVPPLYVMIGVVILLAIGILSAVSRMRATDPPAPRD